MLIIGRFSVTAALLALAAVPVGAITVFTATLSSLNEVPPQETTGRGTGTLTVANDQLSFTIAENYSGLSSNAVAGHVHCCAAAGANAAVAIGFNVPGGTSGSFSQTYDLTQTSTFTAGFLSANGGTAASARAAFLTGLTGGLAYLNIHTVVFPTGEIRGQLEAATGAVPEPASWAMMLAGFALIGTAARRRARAVAA